MNDESKTTANGTGDLTRLWFEMASQMAAACQTFTNMPLSPDGMRQGRSDFLKMGSDFAEDLLRSSSFLESQKKALAGSMAFQKQIRDNLAQLCRELQLASTPDIDQLMVAVRNMGEDLREHFVEVDCQFDHLSKQLKNLDARLKALETKESSEKRAVANHRPRGKTNGKGKVAVRA